MQDFRNSIEKCQALRRQGQLNKTCQSKNDLLTIYQDELKTPTSHHKFKRASTITEHSRLARHQNRKLSYQQSLPSIGEEVAGEPAEPRDERRKGRKRSDARPTFLNFAGPTTEEKRAKRAVVVMKEEDLLKKRPQVRSSVGEMSHRGSITSSDGTTGSQRASHSSSSVHPKRSALRKYMSSQHTIPLSPVTSPPVETSPRRTRKPKKMPKSAEKSSRNPPLSQLRDDSKFTSSEFQADVEDFDATSPLSIGEEDQETDMFEVIANTALNPKLMATNTVTVEAEVHLEARPKLENKEISISSVSSLILPPPPSSRPSSRSASPLSSPSVTVRPFPPLSPSPPPKPHSPHTSPLPHVTSTTTNTATQEGDYSYLKDTSSDLLIPRERTGSSSPPPSHDSPHGSSPCDTETDTDTLLPHPVSSATGGGSLPRARAISPNSPSSSRRKRSFGKQGSGSSKGALVFLNPPGGDSDC